jgi:hypothetical protein
MFNRIRTILSGQRGMLTIEALGLSLLALVVVALIYNATKPGLSITSTNLGNTINSVNSKL